MLALRSSDFLSVFSIFLKHFSFLQFPNNCWQSLKLKDCGPERGAVYATLRRMMDELSQPPPMPPLAGQGPVGTDRTGCQVPWAEGQSRGQRGSLQETSKTGWESSTKTHIAFLIFQSTFLKGSTLGDVNVNSIWSLFT